MVSDDIQGLNVGQTAEYLINVADKAVFVSYALEYLFNYFKLNNFEKIENLSQDQLESLRKQQENILTNLKEKFGIDEKDLNFEMVSVYEFLREIKGKDIKFNQDVDRILDENNRNFGFSETLKLISYLRKFEDLKLELELSSGKITCTHTNGENNPNEVNEILYSNLLSVLNMYEFPTQNNTNEKLYNTLEDIGNLSEFAKMLTQLKDKSDENKISKNWLNKLKLKNHLSKISKSKEDEQRYLNFVNNNYSSNEFVLDLEKFLSSKLIYDTSNNRLDMTGENVYRRLLITSADKIGQNISNNY